MPQLSFHSPIGPLTVSADGEAIVSVDWGWGRDQQPTALLLRAREWLQAYFDGADEPLALPLAPAGTAYRLHVWSVIGAIPSGDTWSYQAVAAAAGGSARSVGGAMAANPIPLLIPCHRVVAQSPAGRPAIGGYSGAGGIETKRFLLDLERRAALARRPGGAGSPGRQGPLGRNSESGTTQ